MRKALVVVLALLSLVAVSCGGDEEATGTQTAAAGTDTGGAPEVSGLTKKPGVLTVGAEPPAPPFIIPPYPENPTGFEVDIAKEIGSRLGLETKFMVFVWTNLISPGPKPFDFHINETTITEERDEVVDFSIPYFEANQAVLVHKGTDAEKVASVADVRELLLGAQEGTTGLGYVRDRIKPNQTERVFPTPATANQALLNRTIDAFVIDLPLAAGLVAENPDELAVVGQFVTNEEWGIVFEEGSPMVDPVNKVLQEMIDDGTLAELQKKWLPGTADVPVLE
ncbi:MAG: ABC transporter substrate-binding protein [Actinomycetota bacterium]|nr:ABC transporter substrate-binding protein [Actinomycetota bacterium]